MRLRCGGGIIGYCANLFRSSHLALRRALAVEVATAERERLARDIHDSVLQVLAFVQRRARQIGGPAAELGQLAGEQEHRLRALVSARPAEASLAQGPASYVDLCAALAALGDGRVTYAGPADVVRLPRADADQLVAAVRACLDNVVCHAGDGARAWVVLEDDGPGVSVTVRDDGVGFAAGRLAEAEAQGRLGVALSVRGRVADLGGTSEICSTPGQGVEVALRVPRRELR